jgi:hypothetical protein
MFTRSNQLDRIVSDIDSVYTILSSVLKIHWNNTGILPSTPKSSKCQVQIRSSSVDTGMNQEWNVDYATEALRGFIQFLQANIITVYLNNFTTIFTSQYIYLSYMWDFRFSRRRVWSLEFSGM